MSALDQLENLRSETQLMAGVAVHALTPTVVEQIRMSDDPEFILKAYNSLKTLAGFDAPRAQTPVDTRPPTQINIFLHDDDPSEVLASLNGPSVPETEVIDVNADIVDASDAD